MDEATTEEMELDCEMLIYYVQQYPVLYDSSEKDYYNRPVVSKIWNTIGKELNVPVSLCKAKWQNLRGQYGRYVRESIRTGGKKKKWVFVDSLSFLRDFMGHQKRTSLNSQDDTTTIIDDGSIYFEDEEDDRKQEENVPINDDPLTPSPSSNTSSTDEPSRKRQREDSEVVPEQVLASQLSDFLQSHENAVSNEKEEPPIMHFLRGILPEMQRLSMKRQRRFKSEVVKLLDKLNEEQDREQEKLRSRTPPGQLCKFIIHSYPLS